MIIAFDRVEPELKEIVEVPTTPEECARNLARLAEFDRNVDWFGKRAREIRDLHTGKYIVVFGQELFVGDDSVEVRARAYAAHPELPGGAYSMRLSRFRGPRV